MEGEEIRGMSVVEERESEGESEMGVTDPKESVHDQIMSKGIGDKSVRGLQVVITLQEHHIHTRTRVNPQQHRLRYRVCERGTADGLQVRENGWNSVVAVSEPMEHSHDAIEGDGVVAATLG